MGAPVTYTAVNDALNAVFFGGRFAGQPVYLTLDNQMSVEVVKILGIDDSDEVEDAICKAVGNYLLKHGDPYSRALLDLRPWFRDGARVAPPCTAILFSLSHAASLMADDGKFGASNYYDRLAGVLSIEKQRLSMHGKSTEELWSALNQWLLANNFAYGRPTARAINTWTYVSKAMSQAVVRAGDRHYFHALFEKFGFTGGEVISPKEMERYLAHWMLGSGPNQRLRQAWQVQDLRERIAESAVVELASWATTGGIAGGAPGTRMARLLLLANLSRRLSGTSLELQLGRFGECMAVGPLRLSGSSESFFLTNKDYGSLATISPAPISTLGEGLGHSFEFKGTLDNMSGFEWQPRLVIPLAIHSQASVWTEVPRCSFGMPHMILVRDAKNMPAQVEFYLANVCMSPPQRAESSQLKGLPAGWVLYQDVQIRKMAEPPSDALDCLFPFGSEGSFMMRGGIQLLPGFYHTSARPHANFIAPNGPTRIDAAVEEDGSPVISAESEDAECSLELDPTLLGNDGNVHLLAQHGATDPITKQVFFRDANHPHPSNLDQKGRLTYRSITSASQWHASRENIVEGLVFSGEITNLEYESLQFPRSLPAGNAEDFQGYSAPLRFYGTMQTCIERGYHHTKYPIVPANSPPGMMVEGECLGCKRRDTIVYRRRVNTAPREFHRLPLPSISMLTPANSTPIDHEALLDALCFLGNGSWAKFQSLLDAWGEGTRPARQIAHDFFLLGFLDLELRSGTNAVRSWSVPPPSLHFIDGGKAYLSGFRCKSLLTEIGLSVASAGGKLTLEKYDGRPPIAWVEGISIVNASSVLGEIEDPHGRLITVHQATGLELAAACSLLDGIEASTTPVSIGQPKNLQWFDIKKVRWVDVTEIDKTGAYRWNDGLQYYAYTSPGGMGVAGSYQVVKLLAARKQGIVLHMHDPTTGAFLSTLGCEPPGLLERALVACSGKLPTIGNGMTIYAHVDARVAGHLLKQLYPRGEYTHEASKSNQRH